MTTDQLISVEVFCTHQGVEITFIRSLHERGLVEVTVIEDHLFVAPDLLPRLEQLARMHYDLDINLEGIEAISHMLERMQALQDELRVLRDRLRIHEEGTLS